MRLREGSIVMAVVVAAGGALATTAGSTVHGDGQTTPPLIAFERRMHGVYELWVMNTDGTGQRLLTRGRHFAWSPDGRRIVFHRASKNGFRDLYVINRDGGGLRRIVERLPVGDVTWSPDGSQIAFSGYFGTGSGRPVAIYSVHPDGTELARLSTPRGDVQDYSPVWSPDGSQIVYERNDYVSDPFDLKLMTMNPDGTNQHRLTPRELEAGQPAWSPDGRHITFNGDNDVYVMGRDGSNLLRISPTRPPSDTDPSWSPEGSLIVFQRYSGGPRKQEVMVIAATGSRLLDLSNSPGYDGEPSWSPDGRVLFTSGRDGSLDIYVVNTNRSAVTNLTRTNTGQSTSASWSPNP
jgi:TolB protein